MKNIRLVSLLIVLYLFTSLSGLRAQDHDDIDFRANQALQANYLVARPAFEAAYLECPGIPRGLLEAVAYTNTHFRHIMPSVDEESCTGMPLMRGIMGLCPDGRGHFRNNLALIASLSGYPQQRIMNEPTINVLAYAKAYEVMAAQQGLSGRSVAEQLAVVCALSELPDDNLPQNFALNTFLYSVCDFLESPARQQLCGFSDPALNLESIFGHENLRLLRSSQVMVGKDFVQDNHGRRFSRKSLLPGGKSSDYAPALWDQACTDNYSSRNGTAISAITLHTVQGSYAGCISWFNNCAAGVSAHYVLRSSDGQVTQMVQEVYKAWHVGTENPYTIGYEHEGYISDPSYYTSAMYASSANLTKDICNSGYGIDPKRCFWGPATSGQYVVNCPKIKGHQNYPNQTHTDPGINWNYNYYYKLVNSARTPVSLTGSTGTLYDSGGASGSYSNNEGGLWLIQPAGAASVTINFTAFDVEADWDYLYVYDGTTVFSPSLGVFTGTSLPGSLTASSGAMLLEFRSDCATVGAGWTATWTSTSGTVNPENLSVTQAACPSNDVTFNWTNSGTGWYIALSTDPGFSTWYWKWVSGLTSYTGLNGFVDHIDGTAITFQPGTTYYWYMRANGTNTSVQNFTTHTCASPVPADMAVTAPTCASQSAQLSWTNSGSNWVLEISSDSTFAGKSSKSIAGLTSTTAPAGFSPAFVYHHSTRYFWRIFNGTVYTSGPSFVSPMCDSTAPMTQITVAGIWQTGDFEADFTDTDDAEGTGVEKGFYQVLDFDGSEWHANRALGFWGDHFDNTLSTAYASPAGAGNWAVSGGTLTQTDSVNNNTNLYADLIQNLSNRYIYHFRYKITTGTGNRRFGFHFAADSGSAENRGNSYFIWFRANTAGSNSLEFYKCQWNHDTNAFTQMKVISPVVTNSQQWYDLKVIYDRITGRIDVYRDDVLLGTYTDPVPLASGEYISFRTGACAVMFDDLRVYRSRYPYANVSVGGGPVYMARFENPEPAVPAARVNSIAVDFAGNLSAITSRDVNIDRTPPLSIATVSDGTTADIDTINTATLTANWSITTDPNSLVTEYSYCIGTTAGDSNIVSWTANGLATNMTCSPAGITNGQWYYVSVRARNGAGLLSQVTTSDGQVFLDVTGVEAITSTEDFSVFPNPVQQHSIIRFSLGQDEFVCLELLDAGGKRVQLLKEQPLTAGTHTLQLNTEKIPAGPYYLRLNHAGTVLLHPITVL